MAESVAGNEALQECPTTFKVTLFWSNKMHQVLYLEAGKDFVDTLFSFLVLPVGTILHILSQGIYVKPLSGISSIFESVDSSFLRVDKESLVRPRLAAPAGCPCISDYGDLKVQGDLEAANILQRPKARLVLPAEYYKCSYICSSLSTIKNAPCEKCSFRFYKEGPYSAQEKDPNKEVSETFEGFVKESITFIITDELKITPSTTITSMSVLYNLGVASLSDLESSEITVSITQILQLLHSALTSNTCLNDVFGLKK